MSSAVGTAHVNPRPLIPVMKNTGSASRMGRALAQYFRKEVAFTEV